MIVIPAAIRRYIAEHYTLVSFAAAFVTYALCTLFYMGGAATNCTGSLLSFPGDNTAGLIALFSVDNHDPWFGRSDVFSYPYGEALGLPTHITAQTLFIPFWAIAKLVGPICSFNILTMIGFMSAALMTFGFVRWLYRGHFFVALLAGFAVAFTPYLQIKTGVHLSYVFEAFFVAVIWLFVALWRDPTWKKAVLLGLSVALCAYTDGYFILLASVLVASLVLGAMGYEYWTHRRTVQAQLINRLKLLMIAGLTAFVCAVPVAYVVTHASGQINQLLVSQRDSIANEAQVYGARPLEYITPNAMNPILDHVFGDYASRNNHGSNPAENVLSLSLTMVALAVFFVIVTYRRRSQKQKRIPDAAFITVVFGTVAAAAFLISLPPKLGPFIMPSYILIHVVDLWRVFARLSVIVNIAVVILASGGLILLLDHLKGQWRRVAVVAAICALVFVEYLTFVPPRMTSGYSQVPELYYWLKTQSQYKEIAEYPLDELGTSGNPVFYNTYQRIHGKKMLNGMANEDAPHFARLALRELKNPQTVPALRSLGIDFITIHAPSYPGDIPGLKLVHQSPEKQLTTDNKPNIVWGYAVEPGVQGSYMIAPIAGFHAPRKVSAIQDIQVVGHQGVLEVRHLPHTPTVASVQVTLEASSLAAGDQLLSITQGGKEIWRGTIAKQTTTVAIAVDPRKDIVITPVNPTTDATLQLPLITVSQ